MDAHVGDVARHFKLSSYAHISRLTEVAADASDFSGRNRVFGMSGRGNGRHKVTLWRPENAVYNEKDGADCVKPKRGVSKS